MKTDFTPNPKFDKTYGVDPQLYAKPGLFWRFPDGTVIPLEEHTTFLGAGREGKMEVIDEEELRAMRRADPAVERPTSRKTAASVETQATV